MLMLMAMHGDRCVFRVDGASVVGRLPDGCVQS